MEEHPASSLQKWRKPLNNRSLLYFVLGLNFQSGLNLPYLTKKIATPYVGESFLQIWVPVILPYLNNVFGSWNFYSDYISCHQSLFGPKTSFVRNHRQEGHTVTLCAWTDSEDLWGNHLPNFQTLPMVRMYGWMVEWMDKSKLFS